ncbi:CPBP family intramembrane glutamic endopeptidase [Bergeyella sp. RCAD1439]|uniref:CPBP family intramembrane glutamic endopeptidase n=1 Tax=Bergeyella anatis TaxID=3113737 RepID=UPI002E183CDA|nr:type II CAAX endopeptidase family protein [Bergeyella sp. RCAD1439]
MNKSKHRPLPRYTFGWLEGLVLFGGAFVPALGFSFVEALSLMVFHRSVQYNDYFVILSTLAMWIGAIGAFDYFVCRKQTGQRLRFNFSTRNFSTYAMIFPMMFGMMLVSEFVTTLIPTQGLFFGRMYAFFSQLMAQISGSPLRMVVLAVIVAPIFEEMVFRGIIQKGLINKGMNPRRAIGIAALIFGLVHGNPWQLVGAVLLGYVLGLVYYKTKSLLMPILLHAFNNGVAVALLMVGDSERFSDSFGLSRYVILGAGLLIFAVFYYLFIYKFDIHHSDS